MSRRRSRVGRMDAAIDYFTPMGYKETQVRSVVNSLLKVYGIGNDGWPLLEGNCYEVRWCRKSSSSSKRRRSFSFLAKKEKLQLQEEEQEQVEDVEEEGGAQQQEAAMQEAPLENDMPILRVHNDVPSEAVLAVEEKEEVILMIIDALLKDMLPHLLPVVIDRTRRACYGWISESQSDSDYEEHFGNRQHEMYVPTTGAHGLCKTRRPSR